MKRNKNRGGRPGLASEILRDKLIKIRASENEKKDFEKLVADGFYDSGAECFRDIIFNQRYVILKRDSSLDDLILKLGPIGNNLNQLAHRINTHMDFGEIKKERKLLEEILEEMKEINKKL